MGIVRALEVRSIPVYDIAICRDARCFTGTPRAEACQSLSSSPRPRTLHLLLRPFDLSQPSLTPPPYTLDTPLTRHAAEALADVLTIEWGLAELKLEGGMIEDEASLKSILHALLISGTLPMLSLAGSRKVRSGGWRLLAVFMRKVCTVVSCKPERLGSIG